MTITSASYADAASTVVLINTSTDGDVYIQDATAFDKPFVADLAAWVASGGVIAPYVEPPAPTPMLNRAQWGYFLDVTGFRSTILAIVANMRAAGVSGLPSDQEIIDAWADAAQFNGAADLLGG